jgi:hypothetical protein
MTLSAAEGAMFYFAEFNADPYAESTTLPKPETGHQPPKGNCALTFVSHRGADLVRACDLFREKCQSATLSVGCHIIRHDSQFMSAFG